MEIWSTVFVLVHGRADLQQSMISSSSVDNISCDTKKVMQNIHAISINENTSAASDVDNAPLVSGLLNHTDSILE
jgi:hypothetical protein